VLALTSRIPPGRVSTYRLIAEAMNTRAYRAVGAALHKNINPVTVPCHRVCNSDGSIGGYSGGVEKKIALLMQEGVEVKNGRIVDFERRLFRVF